MLLATNQRVYIHICKMHKEGEHHIVNKVCWITHPTNLVIRNNGIRVLHAFLTRELLGWRLPHLPVELVP